MTDAQYQGLLAAFNAGALAQQVSADLLWVCAGLLLAVLVVLVAQLGGAA